MSKYIRIIMEPTAKGGGGSFNTVASFKLDNISTVFNNVDVKIDTGCSISTIPLAKFSLLRPLIKQLKYDDIVNRVDYLLSYGVESGGKKNAVPRTISDKEVCEALKFKHSVSRFEICGVNIPASHLYVNYDRRGNILIGMDILKDWDIHIGTIDSGETIFLGCPKDQINDEYLQELERTFHIASDINAMFARQIMK